MAVTTGQARTGAAAALVLPCVAIGVVYVVIFAVPPLIRTLVDRAGMSHADAGLLMTVDCPGCEMVVLRRRSAEVCRCDGQHDQLQHLQASKVQREPEDVFITPESVPVRKACDITRIIEIASLLKGDHGRVVLAEAEQASA